MRMRFIIPIFLVLCWFVLKTAETHAQAGGVVRFLELQTSINPVVAGYLSDQIDAANSQGDIAVLIQLDTPGGLDSAMRKIIQTILQSRVPVIVYVAPSGGRAASAGALITLAADFAVMAPGTNIGAAHPVSIGPGSMDETMVEKVVNDAVAYARSLAQKRGRNQDWAEQIVRDSISTSAQDAKDLQVIDLVAEDVSSLLAGLDGQKYLRSGKVERLDLRDTSLLPIEMNWRQKILNAISNPNVAYLLLMLGMIGIFFEISQPGVILPGVVGAISLLLAFFALQTLPVNYVGILLILLALILFILEVTIVSYGMLTVGGIASLAIGSLILIDTSEPYAQISKAVIAATVMSSSLFFILVTWMVVKTQRRPAFSGDEGMVGEIGIAVTDIADDGKVFVHGEYWQAAAEEPVDAGREVEVVRVDTGLKLLVRLRSSGQVVSREEEEEA